MAEPTSVPGEYLHQITCAVCGAVDWLRRNQSEIGDYDGGVEGDPW